MPSLSDPTELSPDQRRRELAGIFAAGVLRLWRRRLLAGEPAAAPREIVAESAPARLEVSDETVLSVHTG